MYKILFSFIRCLPLCSCMILFSSCEKDYSYEGGTAVYTIYDSAGSCGGSILAGNYYTDVPLGTGNTVQLQVDVTTVGKYTLQTNTRSGIQFYTAGQFANTGVQTISLSGTGTPDSLGSFPFYPEAPGTCFFLVPVTQKQVVNAQFTLAGAPNQCINPQINGTYLQGVALAGTNTVVVSVNVAVPGDFVISTDTLDGISFSASGTFTNTGVQNVVLLGSGTPASPAILEFTPLGDGSGCSFSIAVLNIGPLATYVLNSGANLCNGTVGGTYTAGTALSAANTYTMQVFVAMVGGFTIATGSLNGMSFSRSGTFTSTGAQTVTLTGGGTPVSAGSFQFTPMIVGPHPLGGQACDFSVTVN
jgi:hypothetical protein